MSDVTNGVAFLPAVHFHTGRDGRQVDMIILHWMDTNLAGADATFTGGARVASAHYGIEDTTIHQYVHEADASYNAADWDANMRSIAIEHSAAPGRPATPATIETSVQVCLAKMRKYPAIGDRVYPHNKFYATACPGTLPWEHIRDEALRRLHAAAPAPAVPPAPPSSPQEDVMSDPAVIALLTAINENVHETRRQMGVLLGALAPGIPGEAKLGAKMDSMQSSLSDIAKNTPPHA